MERSLLLRELKGKRALVTGAANGIGRAIALALADAGVNLCLTDIDDANLAGVAAECEHRGVEATAERCDQRDPQAITALVRGVLSRWDGVDVLVNNAGVGFYGRTEYMTAEQWDRVLAINLLAPVQLTRELLPSLLEREESHILNVCSILGLVASKRMAAYHTSKFALVGFSRALRAEFVRRGLGVTALCPGFVKTQIFQSAQAAGPGHAVPPPPWWMLTTVERVAAVAVDSIRRNRAVATVSPTARVIWWIDRWMPWLLDLVQRISWGKKRRQRSGRGAVKASPTR